MFAIGDKVVHPKHGAGRIVDIVRQSLERNREALCYVFEMTVFSMRVTIPVASAESVGLRPVCPKDAILRLLADLADEQDEQDGNWNRRFRVNSDKVKSGDLTQVGSVIRALTLRARRCALSTGERKLLLTAKQIFSSELELSADISYKEAEKMLDLAVNA